MNTLEAHREAKRRWGNNWATRKRRPNNYQQELAGIDGQVRLVGRIMLGFFFEPLGAGPSWQAAFDAVDRNQAGLVS